MKMKIAFYFNRAGNSMLDWSKFVSGNLGINGTHGQFLLLVQDCLKDEAIETMVFTPVGLLGFPAKSYQQVENIRDAIAIAAGMGFHLIVFNNRFNRETEEGVKAIDEYKLKGILWDQNGPYPEQERFLAKSIWLKRIVCVSSYQCQMVRHRNFFNKVCFIYNGSDYEVLPNKREYRNDHFQLTFIGAPTLAKGFHWVMAAWPKVKQHIPAAHLNIIGSMALYQKDFKPGAMGIADLAFEQKYIYPYLGSTIESAAQLGVKFHGLVDKNKIKEILFITDVGIVNPNTLKGYETFCVSALDFQGYGIPVLGGRLGGLKETIEHGKSGILISQSNQLADEIIFLYKNGNQLKEMKKNGVLFVKRNFSRDIVFSKWKDLFINVLMGNKNAIIPIRKDHLNLKIVFKECIRVARIFKWNVIKS
jgi:glycosyltransferase involved in cell wall biosynthesis